MSMPYATIIKVSAQPAFVGIEAAGALQVLGLDCTAARREVKAAYKRLALSLHPDKQRGATPDQAAAVALRFQEVADAHDVLTNEAQRAAYDRVRDYRVSQLGCTQWPSCSCLTECVCPCCCAQDQLCCLIVSPGADTFVSEFC